MPAVRRPKRLKKNIKTNCVNRQEVVGRLYCQGLSQHAIANKLSEEGTFGKLSQSTVCNDLVAIRERWKANAEKSYETRLNEELAKLDAIESSAWESYRRSCQEAVTVTTEKMPVSVKPKKGEEPSKVKKVIVTKSTEQRKGQAGDASFLSIVEKCVEKRMKLLGFLDERSVNINNNNAVAADFSQLFARKDDPQLQEKRMPVLQPVHDPLEDELKKLEEAAGIQR
jgi:hypothetical protein